MYWAPDIIAGRGRACPCFGHPDGLSNADLQSLVLKLLEEVAALRRTIASQRDEIARLKGGSGRPNIKRSGMDQATEPKSPSTGVGPRPKGGKTSKLLMV